MSHTRTRNRDNRTYNHGYTVIDTPGPTSLVSVPEDWLGQFKRISDTPTPNFERRRKRGDVILNPVDIYTISRTGGSSNWKFGKHPYWGIRQFQGEVATHEFGNIAKNSRIFDDIDAAKVSVLQKAYASAGADLFSSGEFFAELGQTLSMLRKPMGNSRRLLSKISKLKSNLVASGQSVTKAMANAWLEYRYGWKPLVHDVYNVAEAVNSLRKKVAPRGLLTARGGVTLRDKQVVRASTPVPSGLTGLDRETRYTIECKVSAGVIYVVDLDNSGYERSLFGLNPRNIPSTIWELVPYSFVVDWFMNISGWLAVIMPNPAVSIRGNWVTTKLKSSEELELLKAEVYVSTAPATLYTQGGGRCTETVDHLVREVNLPTPNTLPSLDLDFKSGTHLIDAAALMIQRVVGELGRHRH